MMARAAALAELAAERVVWLQAQGHVQGEGQRLTLAEAEAEEVPSYGLINQPHLPIASHIPLTFLEQISIDVI